MNFVTYHLQAYTIYRPQYSHLQSKTLKDYETSGQYRTDFQGSVFEDVTSLLEDQFAK